MLAAADGREQAHHACDNADAFVTALLQRQRFLLVLARLTLWFGNFFAFSFHFIFIEVGVIFVFIAIDGSLAESMSGESAAIPAARRQFVKPFDDFHQLIGNQATSGATFFAQGWRIAAQVFADGDDLVQMRAIIGWFLMSKKLDHGVNALQLMH